MRIIHAGSVDLLEHKRSVVARQVHGVIVVLGPQEDPFVDRAQGMRQQGDARMLAAVTKELAYRGTALSTRSSSRRPSARASFRSGYQGLQVVREIAQDGFLAILQEEVSAGIQSHRGPLTRFVRPGLDVACGRIDVLRAGVREDRTGQGRQAAVAVCVAHF